MPVYFIFLQRDKGSGALIKLDEGEDYFRQSNGCANWVKLCSQIKNKHFLSILLCCYCINDTAMLGEKLVSHRV